MKTIKTKFIVITLLCTVLINLLQAQNSEEKLCLWEIQNEGNKVYILGSLHLMPENVYPLNKKITNAYEMSDILAVEADITGKETEIQKMIAEKALFKDTDQNLESVLPEELYAKLSSGFSESGIDIENFNNFKPWFVSLTYGALELSKIDVKAGTGIDMHFLNKAKEENKEILELESIDTQLTMLSSMSIEDQIENLQFKTEEENGTEEYLKMLEAWKIGDINALNEMSKEKMKEAGKRLKSLDIYYKKLFTERDSAMFKKIESYLTNSNKKTYFVIVGVLHLAGEDGLIKMFENKGYKPVQL